MTPTRPVHLTGGSTREILKKAIAVEQLSLPELERIAFEVAFERTSRNVAKTGRLLGISRTGVYRRLARYGIENEGDLAEGAPPQAADPERRQ